MPVKTREEILAMLDECPVELEDAIAEDSLKRTDGTFIACTVHEGCDPVKIRDCDKRWTSFNEKLLGWVFANFDTMEERAKAIRELLSFEDAHWEWLSKMCRYATEQHIWFFIYADNEPQGACIIYHPKKSVLASGDIFYVEFIATAPWNRTNPVDEKRFSRVGSVLLQHATRYAIDVLKLRPGFSLQALPGACPYYSRIGMEPEPTHNESGLAYYEMPEENTLIFIGCAGESF